MKNFIHFILGILFGVVLIKSEVVSWFRIQEMFRFQSFFMYGVIGSAICVGAVSVLLKTFSGEEINITPKPVLWKANLLGGSIFGMGWAMTGACPAPIYALIGRGITVFILVLISAYLGTLVYGLLKSKLPH